jgi:hypothetical protein
MVRPASRPTGFLIPVRTVRRSAVPSKVKVLIAVDESASS